MSGTSSSTRVPCGWTGRKLTRPPAASIRILREARPRCPSRSFASVSVPAMPVPSSSTASTASPSRMPELHQGGGRAGVPDDVSQQLAGGREQELVDRGAQVVGPPVGDETHLQPAARLGGGHHVAQRGEQPGLADHCRVQLCQRRAQEAPGLGEGVVDARTRRRGSRRP